MPPVSSGSSRDGDIRTVTETDMFLVERHFEFVSSMYIRADKRTDDC